MCLSRYSWPFGFCSEGGPCLVGRSPWLVAAALLATADVSPFPMQLVEMPVNWLILHHDPIVLPSLPDGCQLPRNSRDRDMKGGIAAVPCLRAFAIEADDSPWVGMSPATVADWPLLPAG
jgi:hypothetical protein